MQLTLLCGATVALSLVSSVVGHVAVWDKSMFGFNFTAAGNHPEDPLQQRVFSDGTNGWWLHGYIDYPPHPDDFMEFPAGGEKFVEATCDKGASSSYTSNPGGDVRNGNDVCPGSTPLEYHTTGLDNVKGCAFAIAYTPASQVKSIQPEDFVVFSVNHTCVWERFTKFEVPADMPACPEGGCTCAWFWIHDQDAGSEQNYMNTYQCKITGAKSTVPLAKPQVARRCGADNDQFLVKPAAPQNCTYGAKQPLYWFQKERNNMFEGAHAPPFYNDLYGFSDGAQNDIFLNSKLPAMDWEGAPVTGQLKVVPGIFSSSSSSDSDPSPEASSSSSSSSASSSAPSPTSKGGVMPNAATTTTSEKSSPTSSPTDDSKETQPAPSPSPAPTDNSKGDVPKGVQSSSSPTPTDNSKGTQSVASAPGSPKKLCNKNRHKKKRSMVENLVRHRRQVSRRHLSH